MEQTDKELLINSSVEYLIEVKTINFKIILKKLFETLENIDTNDENYENDMYNIIIIGEELIKQFELIQKRILEYHDNKSPSNLKNMKKEISKLSKKIEENDSTINELNKLLTTEKEKYDILYKENIVKLKCSNKTISDLENLLSNQGNEIMKLHVEINNTKDSNIVDNVSTDIKSDKSPLYLSKLNEGNIKVIKLKNDKIKTLQLEVNDMVKKVNILMETNINLQNNTQKLQENITELNNVINLNNINYDVEINILNSRIHILVDENYNVKLHKDYNDDIKKPLLERQETLFPMPKVENQTCDFCNIL